MQHFLPIKQKRNYNSSSIAKPDQKRDLTTKERTKGRKEEKGP